MADKSSNSVRTRLGRYAPLVLWMIVIYFASTNEFSATNTSRFLRPLLIWLFPQISEERVAVLHFLLRKLGHFSEYGLLALLAARTFVSSSQRVLRDHWLIASAALTCGYAFLDEFHQSFVPSRSASIFDSFIDIAGGLFVLTYLALYKRPWREAESN